MNRRTFLRSLGAAVGVGTVGRALPAAAAVAPAFLDVCPLEIEEQPCVDIREGDTVCIEYLDLPEVHPSSDSVRAFQDSWVRALTDKLDAELMGLARR